MHELIRETLRMSDGNGRRMWCAARHAREIAGRRHAAAGPLVQAIAVATHRVDVRQRVSDRVDDCRKHRIRKLAQSIVNPESIASSLDKSRPPQVREMPRRF